MKNGPVPCRNVKPVKTSDDTLGAFAEKNLMQREKKKQVRGTAARHSWGLSWNSVIVQFRLWETTITVKSHQSAAK